MQRQRVAHWSQCNASETQYRRRYKRETFLWLDSPSERRARWPDLCDWKGPLPFLPQFKCCWSQMKIVLLLRSMKFDSGNFKNFLANQWWRTANSIFFFLGQFNILFLLSIRKNICQKIFLWVKDSRKLIVHYYSQYFKPTIWQIFPNKKQVFCTAALTVPNTPGTCLLICCQSFCIKAFMHFHIFLSKPSNYRKSLAAKSTWPATIDWQNRKLAFVLKANYCQLRYRKSRVE